MTTTYLHSLVEIDAHVDYLEGRDKVKYTRFKNSKHFGQSGLKVVFKDVLSKTS